MNNDTYIQKLIAEVLQELPIVVSNNSIELSTPTHAQFGDYTTNISLKLYQNISKELYQSAYDFANFLSKKISELDQHTESRFLSVEAKAPGFINFFLSLNTLIEHQNNIPKEQNQKILIEYVGPNTNKQLHIGHVLNAVIGNSLLRILRETHQHVDSGTIYNDRGIHIVKSMYGYLRCAIRESSEHGKGGFTTRPLTEKSFQVLVEDWSSNSQRWLEPIDLQMKPDHFVGWCYSKGNLIGEEDPDSQSQMQAMLLAWEEGDTKVRLLWTKMNAWFYQGFSQTMRSYNLVGASGSDDFFDKIWYESDLYKSGKDIIIQNIGNGVIVEADDGHVEAQLEPKGLPNIILLRKDKTALYITQDIELLRKRLKDDLYNQVLYVVDYRQTLQFKQLFEIAKALNLPGSENCKHLAYGEVRTPEGAMSSRKGNIISADYLLEETTRRAREQISEKNELSNEEKKNISHQVALAAIKYGLLKFSIGTNIVFDINKNIKFEGDTGPYLQYTYTRTNSIYKQDNLTEQQICAYICNNYQKVDLQTLSQELTILRYLEKWPGIISTASHQYSPSIICEYLYKLAQFYNSFYATHHIISESDELTKAFRLLVNLRVRKTLQKGLDLLGISTMEKM